VSPDQKEHSTVNHSLAPFPFCHQYSSPTSEIRANRLPLLPSGLVGSLHRLHLPLCLGLRFGYLVSQVTRKAPMTRSSKLSDLVVPELYDLEIIPNIPTNFHDAVVITFSIRASSPFAELHA
jgi:hypothetical protein